MKAVFAVLLILTGCANRQPPSPPVPPVVIVHPEPVETFDERLWRTEGVLCVDITQVQSGSPADCKRLVEAWTRGRSRVAAIYPEAANVRMSAFWFYRPELVSHESKPYPLIYDYLNPDGTPHEYWRGFFYSDFTPQIVYSYEEVVEHEAVHAIAWAVAGQRVRTAADITADTGGVYVQAGLPFPWYLITCHGTPDDPFGEPGNRGSCMQPFELEN